MIVELGHFALVLALLRVARAGERAALWRGARAMPGWMAVGRGAALAQLRRWSRSPSRR